MRTLIWLKYTEYLSKVLFHTTIHSNIMNQPGRGHIIPYLKSCSIHRWDDMWKFEVWMVIYHCLKWGRNIFILKVLYTGRYFVPGMSTSRYYKQHLHKKILLYASVFHINFIQNIAFFEENSKF
jgi:hypothetical protein